MAAVLAFLTAGVTAAGKVPTSVYATALAFLLGTFAGCSCERHRPHVIIKDEPAVALIRRATPEDYRRGFENAVAKAKEAISAVPYQSGTQPSMYSEWVWTDRRADSVKADCLEAVSRLTPEQP